MGYGQKMKVVSYIPFFKLPAFEKCDYIEQQRLSLYSERKPLH
jgi:hypothetical protein